MTENIPIIKQILQPGAKFIGDKPYSYEVF